MEKLLTNDFYSNKVRSNFKVLSEARSLDREIAMSDTRLVNGSTKAESSGLWSAIFTHYYNLDSKCFFFSSNSSSVIIPSVFNW